MLRCGDIGRGRRGPGRAALDAMALIPVTMWLGFYTARPAPATIVIFAPTSSRLLRRILAHAASAASTSLRVGGSEPLRVQVIADAVAANRSHLSSSLRDGAGALAPSALSRSIAESRADMKLSPAPTVSTTSTRGAG